MIQYEVISKSEIEPPGPGRHFREDITELLSSVPQDGRALRIQYSSSRELFKDYQAIQNQVKRHKLNIKIMIRKTTLYLVKKDEESK